MLRYWLDYAPVWLLVKVLGALPLGGARAVGIAIGRATYHLHRKLRRVGLRNLALALPQLTPEQHRHLLEGEFVTLGRQLSDFCHLPRLTPENVGRIVQYSGLQHYLAAQERGRGVLFV